MGLDFDDMARRLNSAREKSGRDALPHDQLVEQLKSSAKAISNDDLSDDERRALQHFREIDKGLGTESSVKWMPLLGWSFVLAATAAAYSMFAPPPWGAMEAYILGCGILIAGAVGFQMHMSSTDFATPSVRRVGLVANLLFLVGIVWGFFAFKWYAPAISFCVVGFAVLSIVEALRPRDFNLAYALRHHVLVLFGAFATYAVLISEFVKK